MARRSKNSSRSASPPTMTSDPETTTTLAEVIEDAIETATQVEVTKEIEELRAYVDASLKPYSDLLKKAERLSLSSQSAIQKATDLEARLGAIEARETSLVNRVAEIGSRFDDVVSEQQRFARDSQSALERAVGSEEKLASTRETFDSVISRVDGFSSQLDELSSRIDQLTTDLQRLSSSMASVRTVMSMTNRRGL